MLLCRVDGSPGVTLCSKTCCEIVWGSALGGHGCLAVYSFLGSVQLIDGGQVESAAAMVKDCAEWAKRSPLTHCLGCLLNSLSLPVHKKGFADPQKDFVSAAGEAGATQDDALLKAHAPLVEGPATTTCIFPRGAGQITRSLIDASRSTHAAPYWLCRVDGSPGVTVCSKTCCKIIRKSALG